MRRFLTICWFFIAVPALAQSPDSIQSDAVVSEIPRAPSIEAVVTGPTDIAVGRTIILDASASRTEGDAVRYGWYLGDSRVPISRSVEAVYTPDRAGLLTLRLVMHVELDGEEYTSEALHTVMVYNRKIVLLADPNVLPEKLLLHQQSAREAGVFLRVLQPVEAALTGPEEAFFTLLSEQGGALAGAEAVVLWTDGIGGLQALIRAVRSDAGLSARLRNQTIIQITSRGLSTLARTARGPFSVLEPRQILVTRKEALNPLLVAESIDAFSADIEQRDIDFLQIDESTVRIRPWNVMTSLVNFMLTHGVSGQTVILLLMLPVIAMLLAFLKQVIGITTFGLYTPSVISLSFLALGWQIGLIFLICIIMTGYAVRAAMRRFRLLYVPKVAIILSVVSITLLVLLAIGASFDITLPRDTIFILLIMSTLSESFLNLKSEEGWFQAVLGIGETVLAALLCVFIVQWSFLQSLVLAYPEIIIFTLVIDVVLGQWTGLRVIEYFRFREVFRHLQQE